MSTPVTEEAKTPSSSQNCWACFKCPLKENQRNSEVSLSCKYLLDDTYWCNVIPYTYVGHTHAATVVSIAGFWTLKHTKTSSLLISEQQKHLDVAYIEQDVSKRGYILYMRAFQRALRKKKGIYTNGQKTFHLSFFLIRRGWCVLNHMSIAMC